VPIDPPIGPGARFLASRGTLAGRIVIADDFEFSEEEIDELIDASPA
jgi:hypothetical protein